MSVRSSLGRCVLVLQSLHVIHIKMSSGPGGDGQIVISAKSVYAADPEPPKRRASETCSNFRHSPYVLD